MFHEYRKKRRGWRLPMTLKLGRIFNEWKRRYVFYTKAELSRLNLHLLHPTADGLYEFVRKVKVEKAGGDLPKKYKGYKEHMRIMPIFR